MSTPNDKYTEAAEAAWAIRHPRRQSAIRVLNQLTVEDRIHVITDVLEDIQIPGDTDEGEWEDQIKRLHIAIDALTEFGVFTPA